MVTKIKKLLMIPIKDLRPPLFSFKWKQTAAQHSSNILAAFNRYLGEAMKLQQGRPIGYG